MTTSFVISNILLKICFLFTASMLWQARWRKQEVQDNTRDMKQAKAKLKAIRTVYQTHIGIQSRTGWTGGWTIETRTEEGNKSGAQWMGTKWGDYARTINPGTWILLGFRGLEGLDGAEGTPGPGDTGRTVKPNCAKVTAILVPELKPESATGTTGPEPEDNAWTVELEGFEGPEGQA